MPVTDYLIREASAVDAQSLSALAFRSKAHWGYSEQFMAACREELSCTAADIESTHLHFVVAEVTGGIVGFYGLEQLSTGEVELDALFVAPERIGRGYGRALIEHAKRRARELGAESMIIQGDPNAERFYLAAGGRRAGERESDSIPGRFLPVFAIDLC